MYIVYTIFLCAAVLTVNKDDYYWYIQVAETYAFLPREAVTKFLMSCADCQKRMHLTMDNYGAVQARLPVTVRVTTVSHCGLFAYFDTSLLKIRGSIIKTDVLGDETVTKI